MSASTADFEAALRAGVTAHQSGDLSKARTLYQSLLKEQPRHFDSLHMLGVIALQEGDIAGAIGMIGHALEVGSNSSVETASAYANYGTALRRAKNNHAALESYNKALALNDTLAEVWFNRGNALVDLKQRDEALKSFDKAIALNARHMEGHANRAHILRDRKLYRAAIESFGRAADLNGGHGFLYGLRLHLKMQICDWTDFAQEAATLRGMIERGESATPPLTALAVYDSLTLHRKSAYIWVRDSFPANPTLGSFLPRAAHKKIRLAYFSMDFRRHPVAYLMAELFEIHDREKFEVYAFSYGPQVKDDMQTRLEKAFDHFIDVHDKPDRDIAELARVHEIDIAVDLAGHTSQARTGVFAMRAAPVQINYIGYLGTMAAPYMDYIIADQTIVPDASLKYYTETVIRLPSFQANDSSKPIPEKTIMRAELKLPETGFVFCCFSNTYKITPDVFDSWMRILKRTEGSVLLLYAGDDETAGNLAREALNRGVDANRLIFGERLPMDQYLARYRSADLFLDTSPYNAGATASDALWAGLPVLTRMGESFAGRMAASLLQAIGLAELITATVQEYEDLAVSLAGDPNRLGILRQRLEDNRRTMPLFDTKGFAHHLENAYIEVYQRSQSA